MHRIAVGRVAAGVAAFAFGFVAYLCVPLDTETASLGTRVEATAESDVRDSDRAPLASIRPGQAAEIFEQPDNRSERSAALSLFDNRFSFDSPGEPSSSVQLSQRLASFGDRFGDLINPNPTVTSAAVAPRATGLAAAVPVPRPGRRGAVAQATPKRSSDPRFQLASASDTSVSLAYAPSDPAKGSAITGSPLKDLTPKNSDPSADIDTSRTAIYDITSRTVYMPNGRRLEAHSGLGGHMDDPRYVHAKGTGPTPPNVYELKLREAPFHGVRAIRLIPTDNAKMFGRDGMLAHSYMLGPNGDSNGCVSFKDYEAFLDAFDRGEVNRLVVVERFADAPPSPKTAVDWFSNKIKNFLQRS